MFVTAASVVATITTASAFADSSSKIALNDAHVGSAQAELTAQRDYSANVIRFFTRGHRWMLAPRHSSCRSVPWRTTCKIARKQLNAHRWLHGLALRRYQRLYAPKPIAVGFPPHHALWMCISRYEGSPTSVNPNGHFGMLQMHASWGYGTSYHASDDPQSVQEWAAEKAYAAAGYAVSFLYGQWLNYDAAEECLRYA